jgi:hypothetical protein
MKKIDRGEDDETISGLYTDIQWVARRQLIGSTLAALVIATAACLAQMRPVHMDASAVAQHQFTVLQPTSSAIGPVVREASAVRRGGELP